MSLPRTTRRTLSLPSTSFRYTVPIGYNDEVSALGAEPDRRDIGGRFRACQDQDREYPSGGDERPDQEFLRAQAARFIPAEDLEMFEIDDVPGVRRHPLVFSPCRRQAAHLHGTGHPDCRLRGTGKRQVPGVSRHMDTMPSYGEQWTVFKDPFSGGIRQGRLYGRRSVDMKAGTAAGFFALRCLRELGIRLSGDVYAESVVDEENGGANGTIAARLRHPISISPYSPNPPALPLARRP